MKPDFEWKGEEIYLDNAATTVMDDEVVRAMQPYLEERFGNPETVYRLGREARDAVETARKQVARVLRCKPEEIYFTSGGTESNNWAIKGIRFQSPGKNIIVVGSVEHASVVESANWMMRMGLASEYMAPVDEFGMVKLDALELYLKDGKVGLVSVQFANNEVGTIQPVAAIADLCKKYGALFHCDAVQAYGKVEMDIDDIRADMISISAHKIHGPMGVGALYVKAGTPLEPLLHGGGHESGMRSGTLAVQQIVGFGKAAEMADDVRGVEMSRLSSVVDSLAKDMALVFGAVRNGHPTNRLPNILSVTVPKMDASVICGIMCSHYGICLSTGAACSTAKGDSHVLRAMGKSAFAATSTLRISLSRYNTESQVRLFVSRLQAGVNEMSKRSLI